MNEKERDLMNQKAFELILHAGNSRSSSMEALEYARNGSFAEAYAKFKDADEEFNLAHEVQTDLLFSNAQGAAVLPDILMVHAQDHFTGAMLCLELCREIVNMYELNQEMKKEIQEIKGEKQ